MKMSISFTHILTFADPLCKLSSIKTVYFENVWCFIDMQLYSNNLSAMPIIPLFMLELFPTSFPCNSIFILSKFVWIGG